VNHSSFNPQPQARMRGKRTYFEILLAYGCGINNRRSAKVFK
jgi:hypothetical protein